MNYRSIMAAAAFVSASIAAPAFSQTLSPVGSSLPASGPAVLNANNCILTLPVTATVTGSTGTADNGTNTGPSTCPFIRINPTPDSPATFTLSNYNATGGAAGLGSADGAISNVIVRVGPTQVCPTGTGLAFTVENLATGGVRIIFPTTVVGTCTLRATLDAPGFTLNP